MKNLKEFKELIEKYEDVTVQDIVDSDGYRTHPDWDEPDPESWSSELVMGDLTGFGSLSCALCKAVGIKSTDTTVIKLEKCSKCAWVKMTKRLCHKGPNADTYYNFSDVNIDSEEDLVEACKTRAEYMRDILIINQQIKKPSIFKTMWNFIYIKYLTFKIK